MDERERIGRLICGALHGADPDTVVTRLPPAVIGAGIYAVPGREFRARLWELYAPAAEMVIDDMERQREATVIDDDCRELD